MSDIHIDVSNDAYIVRTVICEAAMQYERSSERKAGGASRAPYALAPAGKGLRSIHGQRQHGVCSLESWARVRRDRD